MDLRADLMVGEYHLRTLTPHDAALVVEATAAEQAPAAWGPRPVGPYTFDDAVAALRAWDPDTSAQASIGVFEGGRLVGALGLMPDGPSSAELAYWVRPEYRGRGIAWRSVIAVTGWAHHAVPLSRIWLEINPTNAVSSRVAKRAGFHLEGRLVRHCRSWTHDDPALDSWHDCDIWVHSSADPHAGGDD
ncbi:MAG TPA: GNAT family N-acetyltransferase [Jiangellales bacterium]|nr:GNAT family N-acetyltransferase [Jiangellales bacterium]